MNTPARTPVIVGVAQVNQKCEPTEAKEPLDLMVEAAHLAARDAGCPGLLARADSVRVVRGIWPYKDPGRLIAHRLEMNAARTSLSPIGGNTGQEVILSSAADIQAGSRDIVLVCAAETMRTRRREHRAGKESRYANEPDGTAPDEPSKEDRAMTTAAENAVGIGIPTNYYAMVETALRHRAGENADEHIARLADLYAGFSAVAASNPHAWTRDQRDAETIRTPGPSNRMVAYPYPKLMTSNIDVDQSVAVLLCSVETADTLGIPAEKRVFPWSGSYAHDHWFPSERNRLDESPAMRIAGRHALELAGLEPADIDLLDLYSCFPAAVQLGRRELGFGDGIFPTVTGGMTFAGGPLNSYVVHSVARMVELLRDKPSNKGFVSGNGGYFTKHSFGVYSAEPPPKAFSFESPQAEVDALPGRSGEDSYKGPAEIEAYTVTYNRTGTPETAIVAALTPAGTRVFAKSGEDSVIQHLLERDACGTAVSVEGTEIRGAG